MTLVDEHISFQIPSKVSSFVVEHMPRLRGTSIIGSSLFKFLPLNPQATMQVQDRIFPLDLRYRSQFAIVAKGGTEQAETAFVASNLKLGDVFFDLGSNWGYYTWLAASLVGEKGMVVAVEMNPTPFLRLQRILNGTGMTNVLAFNYALGDSLGERVRIQRPWYKNDTGGFALKINHWNSSGSCAVTNTIDHLWQQLGMPLVKMVKIDVEGYEPRVLRGGLTFFEKGIRDFVMVEISEWTKERSGFHYSEIYVTLRRLGFTHVYLFQGSDTALLRIQDNNLPTGNVLFSRYSLE